MSDERHRAVQMTLTSVLSERSPTQRNLDFIILHRTQNNQHLLMLLELVWELLVIEGGTSWGRADSGIVVTLYVCNSHCNNSAKYSLHLVSFPFAIIRN